jgi:di/tricarboxylate transporter
MLLPYQGPPMVVLLSLCATRVRDLVKVNALLAVAVFTLGLPLTYLWWRLVGLY